MIGIVSSATYIPAFRLARKDVAAAWGTNGRGTRSVCGFDEDTTSIGAQAARAALKRMQVGATPVSAVYFATTAPAYTDKTNATAIHAALDLSDRVAAFDMNGAVRSGAGAVRAALDRATAGLTTLVVIADMRGGLPGGADEEAGGDGAVALVVGSGDDVIAEFTGYAARTAEFLDRASLADGSAIAWEERFAESVYLPLARSALEELCPAGDRDAETVLVVGGAHRRSVRSLARAFGAGTDALAKSVDASLGNLGAPHVWAQLTAALEEPVAGRVLVALSASDGVDAFSFRTTDAVLRNPARLTSGPTLAQAVAAAGKPVPYVTFLTWRGQLRREPPRRPDPLVPAPPASERSHRWKFGLVGGRCVSCGARNLPPQRVCLECSEVDKMIDEPMAGLPARVATFTVDRLAFSLSPPVVFAVVDFDGGGRIQCEITDVAVDDLRIGMPVEMSFRRLYTAGGIHNYAWKARPVDVAGGVHDGI